MLKQAEGVRASIIILLQAEIHKPCERLRVDIWQTRVLAANDLQNERALILSFEGMAEGTELIDNTA